MTMEMEVDYGFRFTGDPGTNQGYPSIVDYTTVQECQDDQGNTFDCHSDEFEAVVPGDGTLAEGVATHAFQNASSLSEADNNDSGWEFAVPLGEIGATSDSEFQLFVAYGNPDDESDDIGSIISAHIIPDDGESMAYDPDQDWTSVSGTQATDANPLPVELASFDASRDGSGVVLNWSTASETNNAGFEVQHARAEGSFEAVGFVDGAGTTESAQSYDFRVSELEGGTHRFRLKQVDLDGSTSLSGVVEVNVRPDGPIAIQKVSPNPVTGTGTLSFTLREASEVNVALYDVLGRRVETLHEGRAAAGQHQVSLDASGLSSGVYFLGIKGDGFTETRRLTVVR
jgi:hypothetical protein